MEYSFRLNIVSNFLMYLSRQLSLPDSKWGYITRKHDGTFCYFSHIPTPWRPPKITRSVKQRINHNSMHCLNACNAGPPSLAHIIRMLSCCNLHDCGTSLTFCIQRDRSFNWAWSVELSRIWLWRSWLHYYWRNNSWVDFYLVSQPRTLWQCMKDIANLLFRHQTEL